jgi:hypothetical protein
VFEEFQMVGLALAKIILSACSLGFGIFAGAQTSKRLGSVWGWIVGVAAFCVSGLLLAVAISAIDRETCCKDSLAVECD